MSNTTPNPNNLKNEVISQVSTLLDRYRASCPLPVTPQELHQATYPAWMDRYLNHGGKELGVEEWNLGASLVTMRVMHYSLSAREDATSEFWVKFSPEVVGGPATLQVPERYQQQIQHWLSQAIEVENEIHEAKMHVARAAGAVNSHAELRTCWPELAQAVRVRVNAPGMGVIEPRKLKARFGGAVGPLDIKYSNEVLAKCLMLPESRPVAWVGRCWDRGE